jgi:phosphoribosylformylglycinamidine cyclo-ligase
VAETYRSAGVDIGACDSWLAALRRRLPAIGGFGGVFPLGPHVAGMSDPCLVAGADGVGTKLLVAKSAGDLSTVGIDCVAMVVNDLLCCGARPLFFLDYLAVGKFDTESAEEIVRGIQRGCEIAGCDLLGGETAELPGLLREAEFDICGFGVGAVDRPRVIDGSRIAPGDAVIGLPSTGVHSNGFSLARHVLPEFETDIELARVLLTPTRIYVPEVLALLDEVQVKGIAHITGGGLPGNLSRILPPRVHARLMPSAWACPPIFGQIAGRGQIDAAEMYRTFNMGIGLCLVVAGSDAEITLRALAPLSARRIGAVVPGSGRVLIEGVM